jgi:hypothetical protein
MNGTKSVFGEPKKIKGKESLLNQTSKGDFTMATQTTQQTTDQQVLWMADCYSLAKRFPNSRTWLSLLEPVEPEETNPFHYWLWMEIWKAAQTEQPALSKR